MQKFEDRIWERTLIFCIIKQGWKSWGLHWLRVRETCREYVGFQRKKRSLGSEGERREKEGGKEERREKKERGAGVEGGRERELFQRA